MTRVILPSRWKAFFYVEIFLVVSSGLSWTLAPDTMYTLVGYEAETDVLKNISWSVRADDDSNPCRSPVTPRHYAAMTAGQVVGFAYGYTLLRIMLSSSLDLDMFRFLLEAMTLGDVAQVAISAHLLIRGIAVQTTSALCSNALTPLCQAPSTGGLALAAGFATFFGLMRAYFLFCRLPSLPAQTDKSD